MKTFITILLLVFVLFTTSYADAPRFKIHILRNVSPGFNYSINTPLAIDYDNDGDLDVLIISKEGLMYFLENLSR